jgi:hypothetical protein
MSPVLSIGLWRWYINYHISRYYPSYFLLFKIRRFGDWILSSSSGGTYLMGPKTQASYMCCTQLSRFQQEQYLKLSKGLFFEIIQKAFMLNVNLPFDVAGPCRLCHRQYGSNKSQTGRNIYCKFIRVENLYRDKRPCWMIIQLAVVPDCL